mgnify:FL=1
MLFLPSDIEYIIETLQKNGYEAFAVGGCVRDMLNGDTPHDFDITTSAEPETVMSLFEKTVPTGIKHGTVTVIINGVPNEVTTYRTDGEYRDHRRPDSVIFVKSLREDLARRDFTVNAMAYNQKDGLKDFFGGREDIENRILRAVGEPGRRFYEDALRIMRLFRFSSVLGFDIEENTLKAALGYAPTLKSVSTERIYSELLKTLCGKNPAALKPLTDIGGLGFLGVNTSPDYGILPLLDSADTKLFAFLYSGGAEVTAALDFLRVPNKTKKAAQDMLTLLNMPFPKTKPEIKEMLYLTSPPSAENYFDYRSAYGKDCAAARDMLTEIIKNGEPYRISDLKIGGKDLKKCGISGRAIGETLEKLRRSVLKNPELNTRSELIKAVKNGLPRENRFR